MYERCLTIPYRCDHVFSPVYQQHANIVKYKGFVKTREFLYIILEYVSQAIKFKTLVLTHVFQVL